MEILLMLGPISKLNRHIGNRFNVRTVLKNKHTCHRTLIKSGPFRDGQQTKQCVYSIPFDFDRCYISETSRPLEVRSEEHK
jgi:hypothetical protein